VSEERYRPVIEQGLKAFEEAVPFAHVAEVKITCSCGSFIYGPERGAPMGRWKVKHHGPGHDTREER